MAAAALVAIGRAAIRGCAIRGACDRVSECRGHRARDIRGDGDDRAVARVRVYVWVGSSRRWIAEFDRDRSKPR
jgi:hypothetical protein